MERLGDIFGRVKSEIIRNRKQCAKSVEAVCVVCDRRGTVEEINWPLILDGSLACQDCAEDERWFVTGCREGEPNCEHDECAEDAGVSSEDGEIT